MERLRKHKWEPSKPKLVLLHNGKGGRDRSYKVFEYQQYECRVCGTVSFREPYPKRGCSGSPIDSIPVYEETLEQVENETIVDIAQRQGVL
jgi:hypothetical protein